MKVTKEPLTRKTIISHAAAAALRLFICSSFSSAEAEVFSRASGILGNGGQVLSSSPHPRPDAHLFLIETL